MVSRGSGHYELDIFRALIFSYVRKEAVYLLSRAMKHAKLKAFVVAEIAVNLRVYYVFVFVLCLCERVLEPLLMGKDKNAFNM